MLEIRPAARSDLEAVWSIEVRSFPTPWPRSVLAHELGTRKAPACYFVALLDGTLVGYVGSWCYLDEAHIMTLAVASAHRRQGIGTRLLLTALRDARARGCDYVTLEYRTSNQAAAALYGKLGFQFERTRRRYYRDTGEDAVVLSIEGLSAPEWDRRLDEQEQQWEDKYGGALGAAGPSAAPGHRNVV